MCEFSICFSRKVISFARQSRQWQKQNFAISLSHGPRLALRHEKKAASRTISRCSLLIPYSKGGCDPAGIQTQDLQNRNLTLYSAKLPGQCGCKNTEKERIPKEKCRKIRTTAPRNGVFEGIRRWRSAPHRRFICRKNEDRCIKHSRNTVISTFYLYLCRRLCPCTPAWVSTKNT